MIFVSHNHGPLASLPLCVELSQACTGTRWHNKKNSGWLVGWLVGWLLVKIEHQTVLSIYGLINATPKMWKSSLRNIATSTNSLTPRGTTTTQHYYTTFLHKIRILKIT